MKGIKKRRKKNILNSRVLLLVLLIIAIFFANGAYKMYKRSKDTRNYLSSMSQRFEQLESRYKNTKEDLEYIESDTGKEKEIREKFNLAKEGENAIVIIDEDPVEIQTPEKKNIWQKIVNWVSY